MLQRCAWRVTTMNWKIHIYDSSAGRGEEDFRVKLEEKMPAYVIVDLEVIDPEKYERYTTMAPATVQKYGGRYLAHGGRVEKLEGDWIPKGLVILEFPSMEQAKAWSGSIDYAPAKALHHESARSRMIVVEGRQECGLGRSTSAR
jgi:uncharacterized protein (DUF1330 family)